MISQFIPFLFRKNPGKFCQNITEWNFGNFHTSIFFNGNFQFTWLVNEMLDRYFNFHLKRSYFSNYWLQVRCYWVDRVGICPPSFSEILETKAGSALPHWVGDVHKIAKFGLPIGQKYRFCPPSFYKIVPPVIFLIGIWKWSRIFWLNFSKSFFGRLW